MKVLYSLAVFGTIFLILSQYVSAHSFVKRDASSYAEPVADPNAEAEPGIANKVAKYCRETMVGATSHKQFCERMSDQITQKINALCVKAIKLTTKPLLVSKEKKKKYREWLNQHICPTVDAAKDDDGEVD